MSDWGEEVDSTPMPPVAWSNGTDGPPAAPAFNAPSFNAVSSGGFSLGTGDWGAPDSSASSWNSVGVGARGRGAPRGGSRGSFGAFNSWQSGPPPPAPRGAPQDPFRGMSRPGRSYSYPRGRGAPRGTGRGGYDMGGGGYDMGGGGPHTGGYGSGRFSNRYQNSAEDMDIWGGGGGFGGGGDRIDTWGGPGGAGGYFDQGNGQQDRGGRASRDGGGGVAAHRGGRGEGHFFGSGGGYERSNGFGRGRGGRGGGRGSRGSNRSNRSFNGSSSDNSVKETYQPDEVDDARLYEAGISSGINFNKYSHIPCKVTGENPPHAIETFSDAGLADIVTQNVQKSHYTTPTPVQKYAIPIVSEGRDLMACAQTGSGKTAAFLLPILNSLITTGGFGARGGEQVQTPEAVVISPTRELAVQIKDESRKFSAGSGIRSVVAYGGTSTSHQRDQIRKGANVLIATPGRLLQFVDEGLIKFDKLRFLVLDEADRMLDLGFMPDVQKISRHPTMPSKSSSKASGAAMRQTLMFSATFPEEVQRLAAEFLSADYLFLAVGVVGGACADVSQTFFEVAQFAKREKLVSILQDLQASGEAAAAEKTLIFVEQKKNADFLATYLCQADFPTTSIHGDRLQREREEALADFKAGRMPLLVATAVAARGLDIRDVAHVINYDLPKSADEYVHRIGRTGRMGNTGRATSFYDSDADGAISRDLVKIIADAQQEIPAWLQREADRNLGSAIGGSAGASGAYGGKDIRQKKGSGATPGVFAKPRTALEEEESWD